MPVLAVIGSLNVDLTVTTQRFHQPGETITGKFAPIRAARAATRP